ncbi:MAG: hypothetical protein DRI34_13845, partial [Deltaproteobacteria bacterium]
DNQQNQVATEISLTVDTGGCAVRLLPAGGRVFGPGDDEDPGSDGVQVTLTVETDSAGRFACEAGSTVTLNLNGTDTTTATLSGSSVSFPATLPDGQVMAYATVQGPSRSGRSLTNNYSVCATELAAAVTAPRDGLTITDAADQDPDTPGIQVAVRGTSGGVPDDGHLELLLDGATVMAGNEPLRPQVFFPDGEFEFRYIDLLQTRQYTIQVVGRNACGDEIQSTVNTVSVETEQRTCQVTSPATGTVLLAADDKDGDPANDLQYDVQVTTENVSDGATFTLYVSGQQPITGLVIQGNQSTNEVTFADGPHTLRCQLDSGEESQPVEITVDGHPPAISFVSPADGSALDTTGLTVDLATEGVEDGQLATVTVEWTDSSGQHARQYSGTVSGNSAAIEVVLGAESGASIANTLTATVSDAAGNPAQPASISVAVQVFTDPPVVTFVDPDPTNQPVAIAEADRVYTVIASVQNVAAGTPVELTVLDNGYARAPVKSNTLSSGFVIFTNVLLPRGDVELRASANNSAGAGLGSIQLVVGDTGLPLVVITTPADGTFTGQGTLSVTIDSDVESGQPCRLCRRDPAGGLPPECAAGSEDAAGTADANGDVTVQLTLAEGSHELWASCDSLAGATGTSLANLVTVDTTPPQVAIGEPADGAVFNAASVDQSGQAGFQVRVVVTAAVEDDQPAELTIDGQPAEIIGDAPVFSGGQAVFSAVTLADQATHTLGAQACDKAGNCASATPISVTVDRVAPDVIISDPSDGARLGVSADQSAAAGMQVDVTCALTDAAAGDTLVLERSVGGAAFEQVAGHVLTAGEAGSGTYLFDNATIVSSDDTSTDPLDVQLRARITDGAGNSDSDNITVTVNRVMPEVLITRPNDDQSFNVFADMSSDPGFQTQVNVETHYTALGDLLVLCASPGTGYPVGHCSGYGNEVWAGTVTGVTTYLTGVNLDEGDNTLVAFAENIPGQGTYSAPITVHIDSIPPDVQSVSVTSDADGNGCISQAEGSFTATVTVSGVEDGRQLCLLRDWPPGTSVGCAAVSGGVASFALSLADGDYNLTARVTDAAGNPNINDANPAITDPEAQFTITVDAQPPGIAISSPAKTTLVWADDLNQATTDLDFSFAVTSSAEDGQVVDFLVDAGSVGTAALSGGAAALQATMGQGNHALTASVSDLCGNTTTSAPLDVFVDTIKPTVSCSEPADGSVFNDQTVSFTCTTTGTDSTQNISVSSSVGGDRCSVPVDASGTTVFTCNLLEGTGQTITVTVTDPAGNVSDPDTINNVTVDITGCDIAFQDYSGSNVRFNASSGTVNGTNLAVDIVACSSSCSSTDCPGCSVTLTVGGSQLGSAQPLDASGCTTFSGVGFVHQEMGTPVSVEIDDGAGNLNSDSFTVELVDLVPPQIQRDVPGADSVQCVASSGNPNVDGIAVIADKIADAPCDMDFTFTVTDGDFDQAVYPVTLTIQESSADIVTPASLTTSPATQTFTNTQLAHDQVHNIQVIATDAAGNQTVLPMTVEADVVAPGQITLSAALGSDPAASRHADVDLNWTSVADDGASGQSATAYEIRWSRDPITTEAEWDAAETIANTITPASPGSAESFQAQWLPPLNTYHLALRASDELGNLGPINTDVSVDNLWNEVTCTASGGSFGYDMWKVGDLDGDNRDDLVVSAVFLDSGAGTNQGAVFVFYGDADLTNWGDIANAQQLNRSLAGELFGFDVSSGDLDGDNIPDIAVTGFGFDSYRGRVSIYFGRSSALLPDQPDVEIRAPSGSGLQLGRSVEVIGDINGDGFDDLFIGSPVADGNGRGYIFFGRSRANWQAAATAIDPSPLDQNYIPLASADLNILGCDTDDWFSYRHGTTTLGDLDGDGNDDFALIASGVNEVYTFDGATASAITTRDIDPCTDSVDVISYAVATPDNF